MQELVVIPAIHVHRGRAVRLVRGAVGTEVDLGDPVSWARRFAAEGARWIQLVDLDAARGEGENSQLCESVAAAVAAETAVLYSGGVRSEALLERALAGGAERVLIGTAAQDSPAFCAAAIERFGDRVAVGLDVLEGSVMADGWAARGASVPDAVERLNDMGCARVVVRCVESDGQLSGPNYELLGQLCARTDAAVVASGGIATAEDLRRLRGLVPIGVEGAVVGTALATGALTLTDALAVATGARPVTPELDPAEVLA